MSQISSGFIALAAFALALTGCDGGARLTAQVVEADGKPVVGASAKMFRDNSPPEFETTSDKAGCLFLGGLTAPGKYNFNVTVSAPGYKAAHQIIPTIEMNAFRIVLARDAQAFESQALPLDERQIKQLCGAI